MTIELRSDKIFYNGQEIEYSKLLHTLKGEDKLHRRFLRGERHLSKLAKFIDQSPSAAQLEFDCALHTDHLNPQRILLVVQRFPGILNDIDEWSVQYIAKLLGSMISEPWKRIQFSSCLGAARVTCYAAIYAKKPWDALWLATKANYDLLTSEMRNKLQMKVDLYAIAALPPLTEKQTLTLFKMCVV